MNELLNFFIHHWALSGTFIALTLILIVQTLRARAFGIKGLSPQQVVSMMNHEHATVIDIRSIEEFKKGHILNSTNFPLATFEANKSKLNRYKSKPIILVAAPSQNITQSSALFKQEGIEQIFQLEGGISQWQQDQLPLTKS